MGLIQRIQETLPAPIREIIGRVSSISTYWTNRMRVTPTIDWTQVDAAFWDRVRRGRVEGLELSAPLLNPIYSKIAAWALGQAPKFRFQNARTQEAFDGWLDDNHAILLEAMEESLALGTPYLLINADLTITLLPPDVVEPIVDPEDYSKLIGWRITEVFQNPDMPGDIMRIVDEYYADRRVVTRWHKGKPTSKTYKNLIGRLPIIPIPNRRGINEAYGRPEAETLLKVLYEYHDVILHAIAGNKKQGRPTPVIENLGDEKTIQAFFKQFGRTYTYKDEKGKDQTGVRVNLDSDNLVVLGGTGSFKYASPAPFMGDVSKLLELFFYLIVQHSELPEFIFGVSIASSKASADAQLPTFTKFIEKKQSLSRRWLLEVAEIVTAFQSLVEYRVKQERPTIQFEPLTTTEGALTLKAVSWAYAQGLLDEMSALTLLPIDVDDPAAVLKKAKEEAEARQAAFDQQVDDEIAQQEKRLQDPAEDEAEEDEATPDDETAEEADLRTAAARLKVMVA